MVVTEQPPAPNLATDAFRRALAPRFIWTRWFVWSLFVVLWTRALLLPSPHRFVPSEAILEHSFEIAKTLHITAYATFAVLSAALPLPRRRRWLLLALMSSHAFLTEFLQIYVPDRHPSLTDVGIDHIGMTVGIICSWKWWWRANAS